MIEKLDEWSRDWPWSSWYIAYTVIVATLPVWLLLGMWGGLLHGLEEWRDDFSYMRRVRRIRESRKGEGR